MRPPTVSPDPAPLGARGRALLLLGLLAALVAGAGVFGAPQPAAAAVGPPVACEARAGSATLAVVVVFSDGRARTRCTEPGGNGIDVLRRAGFAPLTQTYGSEGGDSAVCAVTNPDTGALEGCQPGPDCLKCLQPDSWSYFPGYRYSPVGAGSTRPGAGAIEAWRWGRSTTWSGARPSAGDVCGEPEPEPTPTTAPPVTPPPGGGGTAVPTPGGPGPGGNSDPGGGGGGGSGGDSPTPGAEDPSSTAPGDGSSTTAPGASSTTAPGATGDEASTTEAAEVESATAGRGRDDENAAGAEEGALDPMDRSRDGSGGGGGGGAPVVPLLVTALVVAGVAGLAVRARRARAAAPPTPGAPA